MNCVLVYLTATAMITVLDAFADIDNEGALCVTDRHDGSFICPPLEPDEWMEVVVLGRDGYVDYAFENPALTAQVPHHDRLEGAA